MQQVWLQGFATMHDAFVTLDGKFCSTCVTQDDFTFILRQFLSFCILSWIVECVHLLFNVSNRLYLEKYIILCFSVVQLSNFNFMIRAIFFSFVETYKVKDTLYLKA